MGNYFPAHEPRFAAFSAPLSRTAGPIVRSAPRCCTGSPAYTSRNADGVGTSRESPAATFAGGHLGYDSCMLAGDAATLHHRRHRPHSRGGHTLAELALVVSLLAVLAMIGWSSARDQVAASRLMSAARLFQSDVQGLRALAVATNREARVVLTEADAALDPTEPQVGMWLLQVGDRSAGSTEWDTLPLDLDGVADGGQGERSLDVDGSEERPGISLAEWSPLRGPGLGNQDAIVFSPRGFVSNPVGDFVGGYISVELVNKRGSRASDGTFPHVKLRISRGGLAHMETSDRTALADGSVGAGGTTP